MGDLHKPLTIDINKLNLFETLISDKEFNLQRYVQDVSINRFHLFEDGYSYIIDDRYGILEFEEIMNRFILLYVMHL